MGFKAQPSFGLKKRKPASAGFFLSKTLIAILTHYSVKLMIKTSLPDHLTEQYFDLRNFEFDHAPKKESLQFFYED